MSYILDILQILIYSIGVGIYCYKLKRKKYFYLKLIIAYIIFALYIFVGMRVIYRLSIAEQLRSFSYLFTWLLLFVSVIFLFEVRPITAVFCATCGYCIQHIVQRIYFLFTKILFNLQENYALCFLIEVIIAVLVITICLSVYKKYALKDQEEARIDNPWQLIITSCSLLVSIFIEDINRDDIFSGSHSLIVGSFISSIIFAMLIIMLEYYLVVGKYIQAENTMLKQIMLRERHQYETEKALIEMVNIRCHDLKHLYNSDILLKEAEQTKNLISLYDSFYKTGNSTLDTVLTMKGMVCEKKGIKFTCLIEGKNFNFMSDTDIYSFFGNLIDNCIEAVEPLSEEKKAIALTVNVKEKFLFIRTENYYHGEKNFVGGLPETTKADRRYHGYGMKSIKNIIEKYNGNLMINTKNDIFSCSIMFCIN